MPSEKERPKVWVSVSSDDGVTIGGLPIADMQELINDLYLSQGSVAPRLAAILEQALAVDHLVKSVDRAGSSYVNFGVHWP